MSVPSGNWLSRLFRKASRPGPHHDPAAPPGPTPEQASHPGAPYCKGDVIGQRYEVHGILGRDGFGVVYLVYCVDPYGRGEVYALKTFRDEFLADRGVRERFHQEAGPLRGGHPLL